jgi:hypothetical protein
VAQKVKISRRRFSSALAPAALLFGSLAHAEEGSEPQREKLLGQMRSLAEQTKVAIVGSDRQVELVKSPVFRYDDQPRRFIDATIWAWTDEGRPVAFQKIEAVEYGDPAAPSPSWQYCVSSVSLDEISVEWPQGRRFHASQPGVSFRPLADAPEVAPAGNQRKRQARELARKFSARIVTSPKNNFRQQMRLLTTPIFEYADPKSKEFQGAVYGFSTNGTNPDLLLVLETRQEKGALDWHFAPARMTCCAVNLVYGESEVWQVDWVNGSEAPFATWTFFSSPRQRLTTEGTP